MQGIAYHHELEVVSESELSVNVIMIHNRSLKLAEYLLPSVASPCSSVQAAD